MRKTRKSLGFTMAEMLIVVAIIMVLAGVSFVAVASHQRSMAQLERDIIAKEIFVAAQNHLTMAESQGYLPEDTSTIDFGNSEAPVVKPDLNRTYTNVYSFSVSGGSSFTGNSLLDLMLPFASIDETVRSGGSYIIRYQSNPAIVLDVFYCPVSSSSNGQLKFTHDLGSNSYSDVAEYGGVGTDRKNCLGDRCVLGWYGGADIADSGEYVIDAPTITVYNEELLTVRVTDPNKGKIVSAENLSPLASLCLIITGETRDGSEASRPQASITLTENDINNRFKWVDTPDDEEEGYYLVILDDVTTYIETEKTGLHFSELNQSTNSAITFKKDSTGQPMSFIPGENITVQAVAYSKESLTNIAYSAERTTNSLFADSQPLPDDNSKRMAMIGNFRHLENLDKTISGLDDDTLGFCAAQQVTDMIWMNSTDDSDFIAKIRSEKGIGSDDPVNIYRLDDATGSEENCFLPVNPDFALSYDGKGTTTNIPHSIKGVQVSVSNDAGLFGKLISESSVSNLELIDFCITTSAGNAGALAGSMSNCTVSNVLAHNTPDFEDTLDDTDPTKTTVTTESGSAGGLIGSATNSDIVKSAAALIVKSNAGNAGGLIGSTSGGSVDGCFSGGHTHNAGYESADPNTAYVYNVTGVAKAGGLIGDAGSTTIAHSYSTCSATGETVGGLVGSSGASITSCYCTGRVASTVTAGDEGAFAGSLSGKAEDCKYFEIINERPNADNPLPVLGNKENDTSVAKIDETAKSYNDFVGPPKDPDGNYLWHTVDVVYDSALSGYYKGKNKAGKTITLFNLQTVEQLLPSGETLKTGDDDPTSYFVTTHYGDWPAPEIFVMNTKN